MASQVNVYIRTTNLNDFNRFILTFNQRTLFTFNLTEEEMEELAGLNLKFAEKVFATRYPKSD